jgi:predicted nucleic acid-binding protein
MEKGRILIDTSAYSAFLRGHSEIKLSLQQAEEISLNPVVLGELIAGFTMGKSEKKNRGILREFMDSPRVRLLVMDEETSERYAAILHYLRKEGIVIPTNDLWIAASAMQHGLRILTTDKHYLNIPQILAEYHETDTF